MKKYLIILALLILILAIGCQKKIGGDKDDHGCLVAAGYQWCESRGECVRAWEDYCEDLKDQFKNELVTNFDECIKAGFPAMESYPRQCTRVDGTTFREVLEPQEYCKLDNIVYTCGSYYKVISRVPGADIIYLRDKTEIRCPGSDSCEQLDAIDCGLSIC